MAETIHPASLAEETKRRYLTYAMSVIMARALPDVRDGLKPVQRRILYTMYQDLHLRSDERPRKSATIVGAVIGRYHPHGDTAAYDALVRMAQDWVMRAPLVEGHGNFGSVDGDAPAAYRYTEARLTALAEYLLAELRQTALTDEEETRTEWPTPIRKRPNFDASTDEPVVLPAQFPNLLVNGSSGIAVGLATNIPPHNLGEVLRAGVHLIEDREASTAELLNRIKGPDFPLGGRVVTDRTTLRKIYEEGTGSIRVQGEWKTEKVGRREQIVITSIPYGVDKGKLESDIGIIIASRKLPQLMSLANESNEKEGLRIVLEVKAETDPSLVMAYLYKHTALQENFAYNLTCLVPDADGTLRPERLGLKAILRHFIDFRLATVRRRFGYDLEQLQRRIHVLEGFRIVFDALDRAIRLIRESNGKPDAAERLIKAFKLDEIQADAILDAQLYRLAQLEIQKILDELQEKRVQAGRIEGLLRSEKKLWGVVKNELSDLADKYPDRRRTRMGSAEDMPEFDEQAYIVRENTNVVLTRDGWIKRVGRLASVEGTRVREGDAVVAVVPGSTLDHVIFLADDGTALTMRINEVPASSGYGEPIAKFFKLADQVKILAAVTTDERFTPAEVLPADGDPPGPYLLVVTAQGQTLCTPLAPFRTGSTRVGRRYVKLNDGDRVVMVTVPAEEKTIYLASANGRVIHFPIDQINVLAGVGKGVMGIKLHEGDVCLGGALMGGRFDKFVLETSGGKTMEFGPAKYEVTARGGKGHEAVKRMDFVRVVPPPIELVDWDKVEEKNGEKNEHREKPPEENGQRQGTLFGEES
jgi:DNA gyrase subunit A